jgi:hypothetical protein
MCAFALQHTRHVKRTPESSGLDRVRQIGNSAAANLFATLICRSMNPNEPGSLSVSEAARKAGVNRRTVQRWIKAGKVYQYPMGTVDVKDCIACRSKKKVGRKAKGSLWENPLFWAIKGTPAALYAEPFMQHGRLENLQEMLAVVAFWHVQADTGQAFIEAMNQAIHLAAKMVKGKREDDPTWKVATGRFLNRNR